MRSGGKQAGQKWHQHLVLSARLPQVKLNSPDRWVGTQLSANSLGGSFGSRSGMSGTMQLDGEEVHVHCGGIDQFAGNDSRTDNCYALRLSSNNTVVPQLLDPLPAAMSSSCHGSDGLRFALAGGRGEGELQRFLQTWVLEDAESAWSVADVELPTERSGSPAGVMIGDYLVCLGGGDSEVSQLGDVGAMVDGRWLMEQCPCIGAAYLYKRKGLAARNGDKLDHWSDGG